ncbi:MAG: CopG family transcriptional regulator [Ignisphaera sp.]
MIKEKIDRYKDRVNWAEEVRRFTESKLEEIEAENNVRNVVTMLSHLPIESPRGSSAASMRKES